MTEKMNIAFIKARWHAEIVDQALVGFEQRLAGSGTTAEIAIFDVPGAYEMPLLAQKLGRSGTFDAIVCAALVVDGGIYRHDFVAQAVVDGLMRTQLDTGVPTFSVSLTPHHFQPTPEHVGFFRDHFVRKGEEAADAVLMVAALEARVPSIFRSSSRPMMGET
ncbi:6,7-dimethyl-8-ribityllumazine synthase [Roseovarius autotrophicus]|uniref:6,7-dimethyl-8-ribityllumazine synthase n=1 Tax=Roseovarius autotrophicus TaxID=2824121 RepID=UPI001B39702E|nr:6,7-dimethyl-8-ribityllumazine synthase [Roseovarius autotrophicus]